MSCFAVGVESFFALLESVACFLVRLLGFLVFFGVFGHGSGAIEELCFVAERDGIAAFLDGEQAFPEQGQVFV